MWKVYVNDFNSVYENVFSVHNVKVIMYLFDITKYYRKAKEYYRTDHKKAVFKIALERQRNKHVHISSWWINFKMGKVVFRSWKSSIISELRERMCVAFADFSTDFLNILPAYKPFHKLIFFSKLTQCVVKVTSLKCLNVESYTVSFQNKIRISIFSTQNVKVYLRFMSCVKS